MKKYDTFWMTNEDWILQRENGTFTIKKDAPEEAQESYKHYCDQKKAEEQE